MIRVAHVIESIGRGGAERLLVDIGRATDRSRFALRVYTLYEQPRTYAEALRVLGVQEECLNLRGKRDLPQGFNRLRALLLRDGADIVHTHLFGANLLGRLAARRLGLPVFTSLHDADYEPVVRDGNPGLTIWKQLLLQAVDSLTARLSGTQIVAVSEYVAASTRKRLGLPSGSIRVIYNAIDTDIYHPRVREARPTVRSQLGLPADAQVVISIGRMTPQKNQGTLLEAVRLLEDRGVRAFVLLAGDGPWRSRYEARAHELGIWARTRFLGDRADVPELLGAADILAFPSLHEGFGLALVEALACGLPVVASRLAPITEIVRDGETGLLVDARSAPELASALVTLLGDADRRSRMGTVGRRDAVSRFSLPVMVQRLEAMYQERVSQASAVLYHSR
jgi:glycosyltransferase involved in cell wall biosynthesis